MKLWHLLRRWGGSNHTESSEDRLWKHHISGKGHRRVTGDKDALCRIHWENFKCSKPRYHRVPRAAKRLVYLPDFPIGATIVSSVRNIECHGRLYALWVILLGVITVPFLRNIKCHGRLLPCLVGSPRDTLTNPWSGGIVNPRTSFIIGLVCSPLEQHCDSREIEFKSLQGGRSPEDCVTSRKPPGSYTGS